MYSAFARAQAILVFGLSALLVLGLLNYFSGLLIPVSPQVQISDQKLVAFRPHLSSHTDQATFLMDLSYDFSSLFHWSTRQLFVYVIAEYSTENDEVNHVVIWDHLIVNQKSAAESFTNLRSKYFFADISHGLRGIPVKFYIKWEVMPWLGFFHIYTSEPFEFIFPEDYITPASY